MKSKPRIARISFANTDPFFAGWKGNRYKIVATHPRRLGQWARQGKVDAGLMSLADFWKCESDFEPLGNLGIAATRRVRSVLLFSRVPLRRLKNVPVGVTAETSTSIRLLGLLLGYKRSLRIHRGFSRKDGARLLIGDRALKAGHTGLKGFPHVYDLGLLWARRTGHSFVFARWVVRRNLPDKMKERMKKDLMISLKRFKQNKTLFCQPSADRLGLPLDMVRRYLDGFVYRLGPSELKGAALFRRRLSVVKS